MSKRQYKVQASSNRAFLNASNPLQTSSFSAPVTIRSNGSQLSYLSEPPDLSGISNADLVVLVKKLLKKENITKEKALEDILKLFAVSGEDVDDPFLETWTKLYPRLSIETSRRVRQLAHSVTGSIAVTSGKRIARFMPLIGPPWLAGLYDNDKSVSRSAFEALSEVFVTEEKLLGVRRAYQEQILRYCTIVVSDETAQSLSDERVVTVEDAESKHARVITSSVCLLSDLLNKLPEADIAKQQSSYVRLLLSEELWTHITHKDTGVRRSMCTLLESALKQSKVSDASQLDEISTIALYRALNVYAAGSAVVLSHALVLITEQNPLSWSRSYKGWQPGLQSLRRLVKDGAKERSTRFWVNIAALIRLIPLEIIPNLLTEGNKLFDCINDSLKCNDGQRTDVVAGWMAYSQVLGYVNLRLNSTEQLAVAKERAWPLVKEYIKPNNSSSVWGARHLDTSDIVKKVLKMESFHVVLKENWLQASEAFSIEIRTSLPEQSKDYNLSQQTTIANGLRWSSAQEMIYASEVYNSVTEEVDLALVEVLTTVLDILKNRNGKPFGAAGVLCTLSDHCKDQIAKVSKARGALAEFIEADLPSLLASPSCKFLCSLLYSQCRAEKLGLVWTQALGGILDLTDSSSRYSYLSCLLEPSIMPPTFEIPKLNDRLQDTVIHEIERVVSGEIEWNEISFMAKNLGSIANEETKRKVGILLIEALEKDIPVLNGMVGLEAILESRNPSSLTSLLSKALGPRLISNLLSITESYDDETSTRATQLQKRVMDSMNGSAEMAENIICVIHNNLKIVSDSTLSVKTLVDLAIDLLQKYEDSKGLMRNILPSCIDWMHELQHSLQLPVPGPLAITNIFRGATLLINQNSQDVNVPDISSQSDSQGLTKTLRFARYLVSLYQRLDLLATMDYPPTIELYKALVLTLHLIYSNIKLTNMSHLWDRYSEEAHSAVRYLLDDAELLLSTWFRKAVEHQYAFVTKGNEELLNEATGLDAKSYHCAHAAAQRISEVLRLHGVASHENFLAVAKSRMEKISKNEVFKHAAVMASFGAPLGEDPSSTKLCNNLIANLTGMQTGSPTDLQEALVFLVILNLQLIYYEPIIHKVAKQRLVFFVRQLVSWLSGSESAALQTEVLETLNLILPVIRDVYGGHWSDTFQFVITTLNSTDLSSERITDSSSELPLAHSAMKALAHFSSLSNEESVNEDLLDLWNEGKPKVACTLYTLLKQRQTTNDKCYEPLKVVNILLCQQILKISHLLSDDFAELYPQLHPQSRIIQDTVFKLLHRKIPLLQEQVSVDVAVENTNASLPNELLQLLRNTPAGEPDDLSVSLTARGYLLSWILVFDHFKNSSFKVRMDYTQNLKDGAHVFALLNFMFEFLGHARGKPYDASKVDVRNYSVENDFSDMNDMQRLLTHVYYLCLVNIAPIVKSWWIDCASRQTVLAVELWTQKHMAPHVIKEALQTVAEWVQGQEKNSDDQLTVAVNFRAKEITASYPIDEQNIAIAIKFPDTFPLGQVSVEGVNRVAVDEKRWQMWLLNTQAVIAASNNNVVDGLIAWKKNVVGALKGQSECAICYSIIGADKQLPTKKCSTCKKLFHSSCLLKWFKSSNSSSCPLCRNPFNYG